MDFFIDEQEIEDRGYRPCRQCGRLCDGDLCDEVCASNYEWEHAPADGPDGFVSEEQADRQAEIDYQRGKDKRARNIA